MHKKFIEFNFNDFICVSFNNDLRDVLGALNLGHSISEIVYTSIDKGEWAGKVGLKFLKSKNPRDWNLDVDEFDNIKPNGVVKIQAPDVGTELPRDKFIIYSFRKKYEDVFGTSNYRILYDLWWLKHIMKRAWGVFSERYGVPVGVAKYPKHYKEEAQNKLFKLMKAIRTETNVVIPNEVEIVFAESSQGKVNFFTESINAINTQITKAILGQTLTSSQGDKGSQALGTVHQSILNMELDEIGIDLAENINEQLIRQMIDFNFPNVSEYPKMEFPSMSPEDETPLVDKFIQAKAAGLIVATLEDEKHMRKILQFPDRDSDTELIHPSGSVVPPQQPPTAGQDGPPSDGVPPVPPGGPTPAQGDQPQGGQTVPPKPAQQLAPAAQAFAEPIFTGVSRRTPTKFEEKVDFKDTLRTIEEVGVEDILISLDPILRESLDRVIKQVQREKIIPNQDFKAARSINVRNKGDVKKVLSDGLLRVGRRGVRSAREELSRSRKMAKLADLGAFNQAGVKRLLNEQAIQMTGAITESMRIAVERSLFRSITNGASEQEAVDGLVASLDQFFRSGAASTEDFSAGRLSTIVRTNVVGSMNVARKEFFLEDSEFVPAFQYSAVLDDRVRPNHAAMDQRIFRASSAVWQSWTPANGFNCRCLLVPVTKFDEWDGRESTLPNVKPDKGFGKT